MNKSKLKTYAPEARRDFIQAVTQRANLLGLSATDIAPVQITGDIAMINGRPWPASVAQKRDLLVKRIQAQGFAAVMEAEAYGWFNRFAALRYMELHGYLDHGYRVLSNSNNAGGLPEILENAASLDSASFPGLNRDEVIRLKLDGNKDNELYRLLLTTQSNALADSMGFLFETLGDETELLLPDNLLNTDSVIAKMVNSIDVADWEQVEIIGWLYQFYISDKKDEVIGKVVKSEDIPAATQLFTPNWIVKYLTQNSIGRLWLMANPSSNLASQMAYYIKPAEQTLEVNAQLDALIQTRMAEDGGSLNPETIIVLDPACGSGHILVEAYDLLKAIYLERGYQPRAIPRLILEKNLFGLDIDDRAAQLAGFALLMKARADDRRLFENKLVLNVMALQESHALDDEIMAQTVVEASIALEGGEALPSGQLFGGGQLETQHSSGLKVSDLRELIQFFVHAKSFGSLLVVPEVLVTKLGKLEALLHDVAEKGNSLAQSYANQIRQHFLPQSFILSRVYDAVIANPPYMGGKGMNTLVKDFAKRQFPNSKSDLFAMFIERGFYWCKSSGFNSMVTMQSWMFLSAFEKMRIEVLSQRTISTFLHVGYNSFPELNSKIAQACVSNIQASFVDGFSGRYINLNAASPSADKKKVFEERDQDIIFDVRQDQFNHIPGSPMAYWVSSNVRKSFVSGTPLHTLAMPRAGMITGNNSNFVRFWHEVDFGKVGLNCVDRLSAKNSEKKWFPYQKGGEFRRWYGNNEHVVDWENDGFRVRNTKNSEGKVPAHAFNEEYIFKPNVNWSAITWEFSARISDGGSLFDAAGSAAFPPPDMINLVAGFLNSKVAEHFLSAINPTLNFQAWNIGNLRISDKLIAQRDLIHEKVETVKGIAISDWNSFENSNGFLVHPILKFLNCKTINLAWEKWRDECFQNISRTKEIEKQINVLVALSYELENEIDTNVEDQSVSLNKGNREKDMYDLLSFSIGCMMGRYSLDEPGLVYAHAGNVGFDSTRYTKFPADADGIVPVTDEYWFDDDAANRMREFLIAVWGEATLDENMNWLADSLGRKAGQNADDAIRSYIAESFFKDHLKTYKKRPIYWLFSSGKHKAFECLVYLHRYNEGTLARMRNEYVIPLAGKFGGRADLLQNQITNASTTSERNKLQKELDLLKKKQLELAQFDEQLRHYADQRISLDLDDGVKVNYGKFGNLLAEVKSITGGVGDE